MDICERPARRMPMRRVNGRYWFSESVTSALGVPCSTLASGRSTPWRLRSKAQLPKPRFASRSAETVSAASGKTKYLLCHLSAQLAAACYPDGEQSQKHTASRNAGAQYQCLELAGVLAAPCIPSWAIYSVQAPPHIPSWAIYSVQPPPVSPAWQYTLCSPQLTESCLRAQGRGVWSKGVAIASGLAARLLTLRALAWYVHGTGNGKAFRFWGL